MTVREFPHLENIKGEPQIRSKVDYIDAVRGWAILLVMTCHVGGLFPELPYPVKKLTNFGWHGVQLFFLASAITLLMSWRRQKAAENNKVFAFFIRRFFRIAPMYYSGALLYFFVQPPAASPENGMQLLRTLLFLNTWHPLWVPTVPGWMVVPGGWSIGVEFTFYMLFPLFASLLTTIWRAGGFVIIALALASLVNPWAEIWFSDYGAMATRNFLYFWFPSQLPVFASGILLYFLVEKSSLKLSRIHTHALLFLAASLCFLASQHQNPVGYVRSLYEIPPILLATAGFMIFIFTLAHCNNTVFAHKVLQRLGVLSFSCYVLHFVFFPRIPGWTGDLIDLKAAGFTAIGMFFILLIATIVCTVVASSIAYRYIENPGIAFGRRCISRLRNRRDIG